MAAPGFLNNCAFRATSGGTGSFTVASAMPGARLPAAAGSVDTTITYRYHARSDDLTQWEFGTCTFSGTGTVMARTVIGSSNSNALVNFSAAPQVAITAIDADFVKPATAANIIANNANGTVITTDQAWASSGWTSIGNLSGAVTLDASTGSKFVGTLTSNVTITIANLKSGQQIDYAFVQDATGGRTISWSGVYFPGSTVPGVATAASGWALFGSAFCMSNPAGVLWTLVTGMHF
jgi:hypothetical protein